jgi:hypothetical protein
MTLEEAIAEVKRVTGGAKDWDGWDFAGREKCAFDDAIAAILNAAASGNLIPASDARLAELEKQLASVLQREADTHARHDEKFAELERQLAEAREVKPLEWKPWPLGTSQAESVFGTYHTWPGHWRAPDATGRKADNPEAAAQADYTARSLSALKEPKP